MDLALTFSAGTLMGDGMDSVGEFSIKGRYDLQSGEVTFHKRYLRRHSVFYRGFNEGKGIWGTWEITRLGILSVDRGGFHIWPKGMPDPTEEHLQTEEPLPAEVEQVVLAK
jgi:hypothetical protein